MSPSHLLCSLSNIVRTWVVPYSFSSSIVYSLDSDYVLTVAWIHNSNDFGRNVRVTT